jgi:hypothetical protein
VNLNPSAGIAGRQVLPVKFKSGRPNHHCSYEGDEMRWELFLLDLRQMLTDFRAQDFGSLMFWALWLVALFSSLRGVDRRDEIAQVTYMGAIMALGVMLILILPFGVKSHYGPMGKFVVFSILLLCPSVRWLMRKRRSELDASFHEAIASKKSGKSK